MALPSRGHAGGAPLTVLLLAACTAEIQFPPDLNPTVVDTGFETGLPTPSVPTAIWGDIEDPSINARCDAGSGPAIAFRTIGWADGATAFLADPVSRVVETHPMRRTAVEAGGDAESYQVGPLIEEAFVPGEATGFRCTSAPTQLTVALVTLSRVAPFADCVTFGDDLSAVGDALRDIDPDLFEECRILPVSF